MPAVKKAKKTTARRAPVRRAVKPAVRVVPASRPMIDPILAFKNFWLGYFDFMGRSTRSEFWFGMLFAFILDFVFTFFIGGLIAKIVSLILVIPSMALMTRRFRDAGISVWWYLIPALALYLIPIILGSSWYYVADPMAISTGMKLYSLGFVAFFVFQIVVACIPSKR